MYLLDIILSVQYIYESMKQIGRAYNVCEIQFGVTIIINIKKDTGNTFSALDFLSLIVIGSYHETLNISNAYI
jgi:hypothetical protein